MTRRRGQPIGAYTGSIPGQVTGRIAGNVLTGQWVGTVAGDSGGFVLNFSADAKSFTGTWESAPRETTADLGSATASSRYPRRQWATRYQSVIATLA